MKGRVAIVTGAGRGIGRATALALAARGARVLGVSRTEAELASLAAKAPVEVLAETVATEEGCEHVVEEARSRLGPVEILVNCAGITRDSTFRKMTPEQWRAVLSTNLDSVFNVTRHVIDGMVERGWGRVVNISSVNAVRGQFGQTNYAAAKAGILGFTKSLAQEVVKKGVTVNAISPGYVQTEMVMAIREDVRQKIVSEIPAGRLAMPEEVADAVAFLASENAAYITGTNLAVNGGLHMYS